VILYNIAKKHTPLSRADSVFYQDPMQGERTKVMKHNSLENLKKGTPHQFGVQWPGRRCGAKTRQGTKCLAPAVRSSSRCRMHGGMSCGPTSIEGKQRIAAAKFKSGKYTSEQKHVRRLRARELRALNSKIKSIEEDLIANKLLQTDWRKQFKI